MIQQASRKYPLLQPFQLKGLQLKNRVMSTSHAISLAEYGLPKERYQLYHEEKAKGGIGLTMFGGTSNVSVDSANVWNQINVRDDTVIPYFLEFSERIHRHGSKLMCQLSHFGGRGHWQTDNWLPVLGPSHHREHLHGSMIREMDQQDIDRIVADFAKSAWRCREGGLDGIEISAHGHLIGQFWSPFTNMRTDKYGGSLENRMRFGLEVLEAIRHVVGDDFVIGVRMPVNEYFSEGLQLDECLKIAQVLELSGFVDFLNLNANRIDTELGLANYMPGMAVKLAPYLQQVGDFRKNLKLPIFHACRVTDIATARYAIADGLVDLIGMTRGHMADPYIVKKLEMGLEERIRPCVGATYCSSHRTCIHNPATGRENTLDHLTTSVGVSKKKKVIVVGAGPAGLEAARVSAQRGHEVILFEANRDVGGQVAIAARVHLRKDLIGIVDWLKAEIEQLNIDLRLNHYVESDDILEENPDCVIIATGGMPDHSWLEGGDYCNNVWEILDGSTPLKGNFLVYDGTGEHNALSCVDFLLDRGLQVELMSPEHVIGKNTNYTEQPLYLKRFYEKEATLTVDHQLISVHTEAGKHVASIRNELTGKVTQRAYDNIVIERGATPFDELFHTMRSDSRNNGKMDLDALVKGLPMPFEGSSDGYTLYLIGDAVHNRDIHAAIYDARRLCQFL